MIIKFIKRKINRRIVHARQLLKKKKYTSALNKLSSDEIQLFHTVIDIAKNHRSDIRFDPCSSEILIVLPQMLLTLKNDVITIQNTNGFLIKHFPEESYSYVVKCIEHEAHRERRKLKHEVKKRIHEFLNNIEH